MFMVVPTLLKGLGSAREGKMNSSDNLKNITIKKKKKNSRILAKEKKKKEFLNIKPKSIFSNTNKCKLFAIHK